MFFKVVVHNNYFIYIEIKSVVTYYKIIHKLLYIDDALLIQRLTFYDSHPK